MSVPVNHTDQHLEALPLSNVTSNWTTNVSDVKTIKVSNVSLAATEKHIREYFSFSGDVRYIELRRESDTTQVAYVTFNKSLGADTAVLLNGATIADLPVTITPVQDYQLPPEAILSDMEQKSPTTSFAVGKAEDVVSTMLAKGFVLGKDAVNQAKAFDERIHLISNASATVAAIDSKIGLSDKLIIGSAVVNDKVKEMDERFHVSELTKSAFSVAEQKVSSAGNVIMSNQIVSTGALWVSGAITAVAKAAGDVSMMTKEKVEKAEEEKKETLLKERIDMVNHLAQIHLDEPPTEQPPIVSFSSADSKLTNI